MSKFKVGDKVVRIKPVVHGTAKRTGIADGCIYTVTFVVGSSIKLLESAETGFTFSARNFELASRGCWNMETAKQLREAAVNAVETYNEYLKLQPRIQPLVIK